MILKNISIAALLQQKSNFVYCTSVQSTVESAVTEMNCQHIGSILVKRSREVVGIFTERDVLTRVVAAGLDPKTTFISEVMTQKFHFIDKESSVDDALQMMAVYRIRHLPVFEGSELIGMLSIGDLTGWLAKVNEIEAENLRRYMFEAYPC